MNRLPTITPKKLIAALRKKYFVEDGQRGSHLRLRHPDGRQVIVPIHNTDIKRGLMKSILKRADIRDDELQGLL